MNLCVRDPIAVCVIITGVANSITISILLTRVGYSETVILQKTNFLLEFMNPTPPIFIKKT